MHPSRVRVEGPTGNTRPLLRFFSIPTDHHAVCSENYASNDVSGNFSLTLIDVLDTFVVLDDLPGFELAVKNVIDSVSFDVNTRPQVFEVTIRVLGGLLSGHIFASEPNGKFHLPWYRTQLLDLAHDLGRRLLPAFSTPTGIPFARVYPLTTIGIAEAHAFLVEPTPWNSKGGNH